jgi:cell division protein FtsW
LYFVKHQIKFGLLPGLILFAGVAYTDYRKWRVFALPALILSIVLLILVYVPGIGLHISGSSRWVKFGPIAFQPSEFVKVTFLIYAAAWLAARHEHKAKTLNEGLLPFLGSLGVIMILLIKQPNTGSMSVIVGSALLTYFIAGAPVAWFGFLGIGVVGLIALLIKITPYRAARLMTFLHPELDPMGKGYQINQALLAVGSGGPFGMGYGHSRQKYLYLPEVAGDSVFAVVAEEMGFILTVGFLALFSWFVYRCFLIARHAPDEFGRFLATGIASWFAIQTIFNVASMIGLMPITGVTLPFVSYGGSSLIVNMFLVGVVESMTVRKY